MATSDIKKGPLYVDSTNNRVGIGNSSPSQLLHIGSTSIASGSSAWQRIQTNGNDIYVGIGSNNAAYIQANGEFKIATGGYVDRVTVDTSGNVGIGGPETTVFNGVGGDMKFVVIGDDSTTTIANNSDAGIAVVNTNQTAGNLAGLHFARADTDDSPNYAGASIVAQFPDAQVTGQYPRGDLAFLTSTAANNAPSEKMRLTAAGNVGIGSTNPNSGKLHVSHTTGTIGYFESTQAAANVSNVVLNATQTNSSANATFQINHGTTAQAQLRLNGDSSFAIHNKAGLAESMRITSAGDIAISATSANGFKMYIQSDNGQPALALRRNGGLNGELVRFFNSAGTDVGSIDTSFTTTFYNTSSDYRLKTDVTYNWDATSRLKQLKPARFAWIADGDDAVPVDGFLAHEVQDIVPEAITGTKDAVDEDGNPVMQGIDQSKLVPLLVKTIIELEARITALEAN